MTRPTTGQLSASALPTATTGRGAKPSTSTGSTPPRWFIVNSTGPLKGTFSAPAILRRSSRRAKRRASETRTGTSRWLPNQILDPIQHLVEAEVGGVEDHSIRGRAQRRHHHRRIDAVALAQVGGRAGGGGRGGKGGGGGWWGPGSGVGGRVAVGGGRGRAVPAAASSAEPSPRRARKVTARYMTPVSKNR